MFTFKVFLSLSRLPLNPYKTWTILSHPGLWGSPLLKPPPLPLPPAAFFNNTVAGLFHFPFYLHLLIPNKTPILLCIHTPKNNYDHAFAFVSKVLSTASLPALKVSFALLNYGQL